MVCFYCRWNNSKLDFKTAKGCCTFNNRGKVCCSTEASKEMIWLHRFMEELGKKQENSRLYCDSESAIHLEKNSTFHSKTKHIQLRYHFIRSTLEDGHLKLEKIHTSQNLAYMLTKGVTRDKLSSYSVSICIQA